MSDKPCISEEVKDRIRPTELEEVGGIEPEIKRYNKESHKS